MNTKFNKTIPHYKLYTSHQTSRNKLIIPHYIQCSTQMHCGYLHQTLIKQFDRLRDKRVPRPVQSGLWDSKSSVKADRIQIKCERGWTWYHQPETTFGIWNMKGGVKTKSINNEKNNFIISTTMIKSTRFYWTTRLFLVILNDPLSVIFWVLVYTATLNHANIWTSSAVNMFHHDTLLLFLTAPATVLYIQWR